MIKITVDLRDATAEEAEIYMNSKTRQFLLYEAANDLKDCKLTIEGKSGEHFVQRLAGDTEGGVHSA